VTVQASTVDCGVLGTATTSGTAPTFGGGPGPGGPPPPGAPTVTLTISSPNPQPAGDTALISYSTSPAATSCYIGVTPGGYQGAGPAPSYSNYNIGSVGVTSTVSVSCSINGGSTGSASATITIQSSSGGSGGNNGTCQGTTTDPNCDMNMGLVTDSPASGSNTEYAGPVLVGSGFSRQLCPAGARYKVRSYTAKWKSWHSLTGSISEVVQYGVCYIPGSQVLFASAYSPSQASGSWFWSWQSVNDNGYPSAGPTSGSFATFRWQGSVAFCVFGKGCGPTKHPGVAITFYPNNTEAINEWVG
jgi:hypothetical protein